MKSKNQTGGDRCNQTLQTSSPKPHGVGRNPEFLRAKRRRLRPGSVVDSRKNILLSTVIAFLTICTLGAGLKYLEYEAGRELERSKNDNGLLADREPSVLKRFNPFLRPPTKPPTHKDLDGDGRAGTPRWRASTGSSFTLNSSEQQTQSFTFARPSGTAVPADYESDGKPDIADWRSFTGTWFSGKGQWQDGPEICGRRFGE